MFLVERRGGIHGAMILFIPFSGYHLCKLRKEDKKVEQNALDD